MTCPPEITAIVLAILGQGVRQARAAGWSGDAERAAFEADHIHNLPSLLADYKPELLDYYWTAERSSYLDRARPEDAAPFQTLWERLHRHVECPKVQVHTAAHPP